MHREHGAEIESVKPASIAHAAGINAGDMLLSVNGYRINDVIDFMFYSHEDELNAVISRNGKKMLFKLNVEDGRDIGIHIKPFKITTCSNKCVFCFVSQLPKGLRRTLYIKDEDYRMSFLYGNYITLTNLSAADKRRIVQQRLSPIYISVHSTDRSVRNSIFGNQKAPDILKEIKFFKDNKIRMHSQVVLCPGLNDGKELQKTIRDLYKFYPYVSSIAVVPVGLTEHRKNSPKMRPIKREDALRAIELIDPFQKRFRKKHGDTIVYGADELHIKAGAEFPSLRDYGDLPQLENGIGMVPQFMSQSRSLLSKRQKGVSSGKSGRRFITFTGMSFYPYLKKFIEKLREKEGIDITAIPIENSFFGKSVTVTGLLTGRDVMKTLSEFAGKDDILLIPDVVMREGEEIFLDDVSRHDVEDLLGIKTVVIESTPKGLIDAVTSLS